MIVSLRVRHPDVSRAADRALERKRGLVRGEAAFADDQPGGTALAVDDHVARRDRLRPRKRPRRGYRSRCVLLRPPVRSSHATHELRASTPSFSSFTVPPTGHLSKPRRSAGVAALGRKSCLEDGLRSESTLRVGARPQRLHANHVAAELKPADQLHVDAVADGEPQLLERRRALRRAWGGGGAWRRRDSSRPRSAPGPAAAAAPRTGAAARPRVLRRARRGEALVGRPAGRGRGGSGRQWRRLGVLAALGVLRPRRGGASAPPAAAARAAAPAHGSAPVEVVAAALRRSRAEGSGSAWLARPAGATRSASSARALPPTGWPLSA